MISVSKLYPTESIASIMPETIEKNRQIINGNGESTNIIAFTYNNHTFIADGHCQFLAATLDGAKQVAIRLVDISAFTVYANPENIKLTLASVGKSTLYDFEAIGGFVYDEYPSEYER